MMPSINLMSPHAQRHKCIRTRLRQWGRVLFGLLSLLAVATGERYLAYHQAAQQQLLMEAAYDPVEELKAANKMLAKQISAIRGEEQFVLALSEQEPTITLLGVLSRAVADGKERVFLQKIELNNKGFASGSPTEKQTVLDLAGTANSGAAVNEFADTLRSAVSFGQIEVTSSNEYRIKQQAMQDFSLQCNY